MQNVIEFDDTVTGIEHVTTAAKDLTAQAGTLRRTLTEAFKIRGMNDYRQTVQKYGKDMADSLLVFQLRLGQLKNAIADAAIPLSHIFIPAINRALTALTGFFHHAAQVFSLLLLGEKNTGGLAKNAEKAEKKQNKLNQSIRGTGKAVRASLASFDELEKMNGGSGGSGSSAGNQNLSEISLSPNRVPGISQEAEALAGKLKILLEPLTKISFDAVCSSFENLKNAVKSFLNEGGSQLQWLWFNVLVPLGKWTVEQAAPEALNILSEAFGALKAVLEPVNAGFRNFLGTLQPIGGFISNIVLELLDLLKEKLHSLTQLLTEKSPEITEIITLFGTIIAQMWNAVEPILTALFNTFKTVFDGIWKVAELCIGSFIDLLDGLLTFISQIFAGNFTGAWETIKETFVQWVNSTGDILKAGFTTVVHVVLELFTQMGNAIGNIFGNIKNTVKGAVNSLIGFINGMISGVVSGINAMTSALNKIHFSIPSWIPALGGRSFGFSISAIRTPRIPYLAQGAVLPANRPFLSVVGDQRHGTNIEAPLEMIQEAVANVMGDMSSGMMAGFEASVGVQREILEAVLGIHIGDDMISSAVTRYNRKMNVVNGGAL